MKNIYILTPLIFSFYFLSAQYKWTGKANYAGGVRYGAIAFSIGAKGYIGAGLNSALNVTNDFWEYDTLSNAWTQKANIGTAGRFGAVGFAVGNYGYVGLGTTYYDGGYSYVWSTDFWQYDPTSNTWTQKGNFPGPGRYATISFTIGNKGYMGGGWGYNDFWQYNPATDIWTQLANLGGSLRESGTGFAINNKGYVTSGLDGNSPLTDLWEYDTLANSWTQKASLPGTARFAATSFVLCNYAYVGLGSSNYPTEVELKDFWRYDPSANSWIQIVNFPSSARNGAVDFVIGDNAYIGTGAASTATAGFTNDFWEFNSDSCPATVSINSPIASFQESANPVCANNCVNFSNQSSNATSWQWSFPGAYPDTSTIENPQNICYSMAGTYSITLVASNATGSATLSTSIQVIPAPIPPFIKQDSDTLYFNDNPLYSSYQWSLGDSLIQGATDTFLVISQSGIYNVEVTSENGCKIVASSNITLAVQNYFSPNVISLYPNPVFNQLTIQTSSFQNEGVMVSLTDVLGRIISSPAPLLKGRNVASIDVNGLASGIYFVEIASEKERWVGKFVKE